jgi:hypothetical protein
MSEIYVGYFWSAISETGKLRGAGCAESDHPPLLIERPGPYFVHNHERDGYRICRVRVTIEEVRPEAPDG